MTKKLIALVDTFDMLCAHDMHQEISIHIAHLGADGKPRNYRLDSCDPTATTGGCHARMWADRNFEGQGKVYFGAYGPEISHGDLADYAHGVRACKLVSARLARISAARGYTDDAAESFGRWLEACGITAVYVRPADHRGSSWLSEGQWQIWTIGKFVNEARAKYPQPIRLPEPVTT